MALSYRNDEDIDQLNNPADRLSASESNAAFVDDYDNMSADSSQENANIDRAKQNLDYDSGKNIDNARKREDDFSSNVSSRNAGNKQKLGLKGFIKKNSKNGVLPSSTVLISLIVGIFGIGGMSLNSLMFLHLKENFTDKFDTQNTSLTIRSEHLWAKKMAGENTRGDCNVTKILCRYSKPSGHMLKQLKKNGIIALDAEGKPVEHKKLWPDKRPVSYSYEDGGKISTVSAEDFAKKLKNDPNFRSKFRAAYNPRWVGYADSVFRKVIGKFGIPKNTGKDLDAKDNKSLKEKLAKGNGSRGDSIDKNSGPKGFDRVASGSLNKLTDTLKAAGRGGMASMAVGAGCILADVPSFVSSISRQLQMVQLVQYAFPFLSVADSIKYGDGNGRDIGLVGDLLTSTVDGKSAMDSYGMKYALFGDTAPQDDSYKKFIAGGTELATTTNKIDDFLGGENRKEICKNATSPEAAAAIAGSWAFLTGATGGTALIAAAINYGIGLGISKTLDLVAEPIINGFIALIPDSVKESTVKLLVGDMTEDLAGQDVGDALVSGSANMMAETANNGGNMPLSVDQAVAYEKGTRQIELAYAEEVRATNSPFDMSTKHTFMGSIVNNMLPYYGKISSVTDAMSTIGSITASSFESLFNVSAAENNSAEYEMCDIPSIKDSGVAAGPFCNIAYGIPMDVLGRDADEVAQYMIDNDNIDDDGNIEKGSSYETWIEQCANGDPQYAMSCQIAGDNKEMYSNFSLYTVDSRVQKSMDDPEETKPQDAGGGDSSDSGDTGETVDGSVQDLAKEILKQFKDGKISFQSNTKSMFEALADGKKAPVPAKGTSTDVDVNLMKFLVDLVNTVHKEHKIMTEINFLTNGRHSNNSTHYTGKGVDLGCNIIERNNIGASGYTGLVDKVGKKYGITRFTGESCSRSMGHHLHYSTTGR